MTLYSSIQNILIVKDGIMNELNQPLYLKIYNSLIDRIKQGEFQDGDRISTEMELAHEFEVSRITSRKAMDMLAENGYLKRTPGKGSFVTTVNILNNDQDNVENNKIRNTLIGFIIPDFSASYGIDLLSGAEKEACENECNFMFYRTYGRQDLEEKAIDSLLDKGAGGIILMPVHGEHYNPKIFKMVLDEFPFVLIDRNLKGIPAPFIGTDNISAAKKMTDYLLDLGHKTISFISPPAIDTSTIEDRIEGFVRSHAERGVAVNQSLWQSDLTCTVPDKNTDENIKADIEKIKNLITNNPDITCFFAVEYNLALVVLEAIKSLNKKVPDDFSIVCFDGPFNYIGDYAFTHIRQKETEMGVKAVKMLLTQMKSKNGNDKVYIEAEIIIGSSTKRIDNKKQAENL